MSQHQTTPWWRRTPRRDDGLAPARAYLRALERAIGRSRRGKR